MEWSLPMWSSALSISKKLRPFAPGLNRVIQCLTTLFPTFLLTEIPIRFSCTSCFNTYMIRYLLAYDLPLLYTRWKSPYFFRDSENNIFFSFKNVTARHYRTVTKKATYLRPMLTILFFLLLFWQLKLFFRLLCSFLPGIREPWIWISFSAEMSSSYFRHLLFTEPNLFQLVSL